MDIIYFSLRVFLTANTIIVMNTQSTFGFEPLITFATRPYTPMFIFRIILFLEVFLVLLQLS